MKKTNKMATIESWVMFGVRVDRRRVYENKEGQEVVRMDNEWMLLSKIENEGCCTVVVE